MNAMDSNGKAKITNCFKPLMTLVGLFVWAWAGIGLYMYCNQMSEACKGTEIAKVLFAWSLIPYCILGLICCCLPCLICGVFGVAAAANGVDLGGDNKVAGNKSEMEDLV